MPKAAKNLLYLTKRNLNLNNTEAAHRFTFTKEERLCSIKHISQLIEEGAAYYVAPLKFIYRVVTPPAPPVFPAQVLIIAPKRIFKTSPARNSIKRRLRECYRLSKHPFYAALTEQNLHLHLAVIYNKPLLLPYDEVLKAMEKGLQKVLLQVQKKEQ